MHARQQIVVAVVVALIAGVPSIAADRVFEDDGSTLSDKKLPALLVRAGDEVVEENASFKNRRLRLEVYAAVAGGDDMQARLAAIAVEVEKVLDEPLLVGAVTLPMVHRGISGDANAATERTVAHLVFHYETEYQTVPGQPEEFLP